MYVLGVGRGDFRRSDNRFRDNRINSNADFDGKLGLKLRTTQHLREKEMK